MRIEILELYDVKSTMYYVFEIKIKDEILRQAKNDKICCIKVDLSIETGIKNPTI
ncbi:hypothetical protein OBK15_07230 [Empedobacter falsenii]